MSSEISIVVPVYNVSTTLPQLLTTVASQTLLPREVIFIDSGSTDDSVAIVNEFTKTGAADFDLRTIINPGGLPIR